MEDYLTASMAYHIVFRHLASDRRGRIERMTQAQIGVCLDYISKYREEIVRKAAERAALIIPLFEGNQCDVVLRLEGENVDGFREDADTTNHLLDLLQPSF